MTSYRVYGLVVDSPFPIGVALDDAGIDPDVVISILDEPAQPAGDPSDDVIARLEADRVYYRLYRLDPRRYVFRFDELGDVDITLGAPITVDCRRLDGSPSGRLEVVLAGTVMAAILMLERRAVLHASAVERDGSAIALVGNSGSGKSTLAAFACIAGARLVTDDVLRVESSSGSEICYRGASAIRLRETSKALTTQLATTAETSSDGRRLWRPPMTPLDRLPLSAILLVRLRPADQTLVRQRLEPKRALLALLACPRIHDWTDVPTASHLLGELADLVETVPVSLLDVPWGLDVDDDHLDRLSHAIFLDSEGGER
jgi:hypothetical protein